MVTGLEKERNTGLSILNSLFADSGGAGDELVLDPMSSQETDEPPRTAAVTKKRVERHAELKPGAVKKKRIKKKSKLDRGGS